MRSQSTFEQDGDHLYIFLHIPRCAGTTFTRNLICNLPRDSIFGVTPRPGRTFPRREDVDDYIGALSKHQKDKIRVLYGHSVYYGIHKHFDLNARYVTFLRNPVTRTISNYYYFLSNYSLFVNGDQKLFPKQKNALTFEQWLHIFPANLQTGTVLNYMVDDKAGWETGLELNASHLAKAKAVLDDFYFVGLTDSFVEDSFYLYGRMNSFRLLRKPQNVGTKHDHREGWTKLVESIESRDALDMALYEHAQTLNRSFKMQHADFDATVRHVKNRRRDAFSFRFMLINMAHRLIGIRWTLKLTEVAVKPIRKLLKSLA